MTLRIAILLILFSWINKPSFAHQDFWLTNTCGNVFVRVSTGFEYEEIRKAFIIGQLAEQFAAELKHSDKIFLDFDHFYVSNFKPDYFISYEKVDVSYTEQNGKFVDLFYADAIVIKQVSHRFDVTATLKLLEYAIHNQKDIVEKQKIIEYDKQRRRETINTIDTHLIKAILKKEPSNPLKNTLQLEIANPREKNAFGFSYFWQNNSFHITMNLKEVRKTLLSIDNIYQIEKFGNHSAIIFDTDSSFYFANASTNPKISKRWIIHNTHNYHQTYNVKQIGDKYIAIYFYYYTDELGSQPKHRTLIYNIKKQELIENLDELFDK